MTTTKNDRDRNFPTTSCSLAVLPHFVLRWQSEEARRSGVTQPTLEPCPFTMSIYSFQWIGDIHGKAESGSVPAHALKHTLNRLVWTCAEQDGNPRLTNNSFGEKPLRRGTRETEPCPRSHSTSADLKKKIENSMAERRARAGMTKAIIRGCDLKTEKKEKCTSLQDSDWTELFFMSTLPLRWTNRCCPKHLSRQCFLLPSVSICPSSWKGLILINLFMQPLTRQQDKQPSPSI